TAPTGNAFLSPSPAIQGQSATLQYEVASGPLSAEAAIFAHITYNSGAITVSPDPAMTYDGGSHRWSTTFTVDGAATSLQATSNTAPGTTTNPAGPPCPSPVNPAPPVADFPATPVSGEAPLTVNFTNASTGATSYSWDFNNDGTADSTDAAPSHIYS